MRQLLYVLFCMTFIVLLDWPLNGQEPKGPPKSEVVPLPKKGIGPVGPPMQQPLLGPIGPPVYPGPVLPGLVPLNCQKLVFIAESEGASTLVVDQLTELSGDLGLKLRIQMCNWCRQDHKTHDFTDRPAHLKAAARIAGWTRLIRRDCPAAEIYFMGHGAGGVVLAAAEMLPEQSVNRIIILAAGVSCTYDLRPALYATCSGIDSFWSSEDDFLERIVESRGTAEGGKGHAAGRVGFRIPPWCDPRGVHAYRTMLRQHKWVDGLHGQGGHYAWTIKHNIQRCIVPLFLQPQITYQSVMAPHGLPIVR